MCPADQSCVSEYCRCCCCLGRSLSLSRSNGGGSQLTCTTTCSKTCTMSFFAKLKASFGEVPENERIETKNFIDAAISMLEVLGKYVKTHY